jgi:hypothetical protein
MSVSRGIKLSATSAMALTTASLGFVLAAPTAAADLVTSCVGTAGAVTVPGDLRVPADKSCVLDGTTVTGNVTVAPGANLVITGGDFQGNVQVRDDAYFDALGTSIAGNVNLTDAYGVFLADLDTDGAVRVNAKNHPERPAYAYLSNVNVGTAVNANSGEVFAENSSVAGSVTGTDVSYLDLVNVVVDRNVAVTNSELGSVFCGGEVYGDASYTGNAGPLQIGADGPVVECTQASYWGGNVTVSDNTGGVTVGNNIIRGNLAGTGNTPAPTGSENRVRGEISGQFAELSPTAESQVQMRTFSAQSVDRSAVLDSKTEQRREAARAEGAQAGQAKL